MDNATAVLFGKTRQAVLARLFEQPDKPCYLRELSRHTGISTGALQQELMQLYKADLLLRTEDGNRVLYRANTAHPLFPELLSIVHKTCGLPAQIKAALHPIAGNITYAAIYGSVAKGGEHARSDVDILIVGTLSFEQAIQAIAPIEEQIGREISLRLFSPEEFRTKRGAGDSFIRSVLGGEHIDLLGTVDDA